MHNSLFGNFDIAATQYLYGLATKTEWTSLIAILFSDGLLVLGFILYVVAILPMRRNGTYVRTVFHDLSPAVMVGIIAYAWKFLFPMERPYLVLHLTPLVGGSDPMSSFPSWHTAVFAAFACTIIFHYRKLGVILLSFLPFLMIGRVAIGVHFVSDVVAGAFLGVMTALRFHLRAQRGRLAEKLFNKLEPFRKKYQKSHDAS